MLLVGMLLVGRETSGVVLAMPPAEKTSSWNCCRYGEDFMWRRPSESFAPEQAGDDPYGQQVPMDRAVPLWGGCSAGGFAIVAFHVSTSVLMWKPS